MADALAKMVKKALAGATKSSLLRGRLVSVSGASATVDVSGSRIPVFILGTAMPDVGDDVWILFVGTTALMLGSARQKPATGTVASAPSGGFVSVSTAQGTISARYDNSATLSTGQIVQLGAHNGDPFVFAVSSATPAAPAPPAPPPSPEPSGPTSHAQTFTATATRSYYTGGARANDQVYDSSSLVGCWFYGSAISSTIPDAATITSVKIYLPAIQVKLGNPKLGTHLASAPTATQPPVSSAATIGGNSGWVTLPNSIGEYLKSHTGGIGTGHGGYNIYKSVSANPRDGLSGALKIGWTV